MSVRRDPAKRGGRPRRAAPRAAAPVLAALLLFAGIGSAEAGAARGLEIGFQDSSLESADPEERQIWADRIAGAGAGVQRFFVYWGGIAPSQPLAPRDPADPAYDFSRLDRAINAARAEGLEPLLSIFDAPDWAEGAGRPADATAGTWKPDPEHLGDFAAALAERYSGKLAGLPRVRYFQDWNEPNVPAFMAPQWQGDRLVSARLYRKMNNEVWDAVKGVHRSNLLVGAGLSPYGDDPGGRRSRPLRFWREVFCLEGRRKLRPVGCVPKRNRVRMDITAHHPINTSGPPDQSASHPDDASSADLRKVLRIFRKAERTKRLLPGRRGRPLWATEFWFESNPPDHVQGVPLGLHARYTAESLYLAWKAGASAMIALQFRDSEFDPDDPYRRSVTGAYFSDGRPKPTLRAYQFPFVADRKARRKVALWGKAPRRGRVIIQRRRGSGWKRVAKLRAGRSRVFFGTAKIRGNAELRAKSRRQKSLASRPG